MAREVIYTEENIEREKIEQATYLKELEAKYNALEQEEEGIN